MTPNERYRLLVGCVTPRPIAFVTSCTPDGTVNLAPFSFFNAVGADPMLLVFCPVSAEAGDKDTLLNVSPPPIGTGELVVNLAVEEYAREVAATAEPLPRDRSELELVTLTTTPSTKVKPPRIAESPVCFECRTHSIIRTNEGRPMSGNLVLAEVVHVYVRDDLINARLHVDQRALHTVGRLGGPSYCRTRDQFELVRGPAALAAPDPRLPEE